VACPAYIYKIGKLWFSNHQSEKGIHFSIGNRAWPSLKGVFAKNEMGYRLNAIKSTIDLY